MKKIFLLCMLCYSLSLVTGQNTTNTNSDKKFGISFSGFIKSEAAFDTRQIVNTREAMLVFYPANILLDKNGEDINAKPGFNQYAMASRLTGTITGPDAFGAKAMAYLEGDFTGPSSAENNAFRLRHAYLKLTWTNSELLTGQYWHPLNVPEMIPYVISLNTGAPFHPFSRQPQIRFTHNFGKIKFVAVASSDRDYASIGPLGTTYEYQRNSAIPNFDAQLQYKNEDKIFFGIGADYRKLTPRLKTDSGYIADESLDCIVATAFAKINFGKVTVKLQGVFGQNLYEHLMMGGFAMEKIDTATGRMTWTNLTQLTCWTDISTNNKEKFNAGLFAGYAKNMGSQHNIWGASYGRGNDIAYVYRVSPRITYTSGNVTLASEFEYTTAAYGKADWLGEVQNTKNVSNLRILLAAVYNF
jgi:hypothetical protein